MIKLSNLEKYFNRNRSNEIHVINDISLTLPEKGLVGPSGSGKTTLLNVLGGLDKLLSGEIDFDGNIINSYSSRKWDHIRNEHIGYVFQNYNLLYDQSVYDNIALSLKMVGITDKEEIDKRIDYILDQMGMINFKRRRSANLSGGQQQRVAIARALAKNPKVIIADEPTGNLDSKNTYDIMNILKSIAKNKLIVLVTHEEELASMYADRIIRLTDGEITTDTSNNAIGGGVDVKLETDIYLKDLNQLTEFEDNNKSYKVYSDEDTETNFDVKLIVKNKTLYIQVDSDDYKRVNLLSNESEIKVFDAHFTPQEITDFVETDFDLEKVIDNSKKKEKHSVISFKESIRLALSRFKVVKVGKIFLYLLFFFNAAIVGLALSLLFNAYTSDNVDFTDRSINIIEYTQSSNYDYYLGYEDEEIIEYLDVVNIVNTNIDLPKIYQTNGNSVQHSAYGVYAEFIDESTIIHGRNIEGHNEVVLNEYTLNQLMNYPVFESLGISDVKDFLSLNLSYDLRNPDGSDVTVEVEIVGITNVDERVFYATEETLLMMKSNIAITSVYANDYTITEGVTPTDYKQVLVSNEFYPTGVEDGHIMPLQGIDVEVEGLYDQTDETVPGILMTKEAVKEYLYTKQAGENSQTISYFTLNPTEALLLFDEDNVEYPYEIIKAEFMEAKLLANLGYILFAAVFLIASAIASFFVLRSSLLSRIYEVSVYRALGTPKLDLIRIFFTETLILTIFTSLLGYLLTSFVLLRLQLMTEGYFEIVRITPLSFVIGLAIIFTVNLLSGVLPISNLLRKTPAQIISKYDF